MQSDRIDTRDRKQYAGASPRPVNAFQRPFLAATIMPQGGAGGVTSHGALNELRWANGPTACAQLKRLSVFHGYCDLASALAYYICLLCRCTYYSTYFDFRFDTCWFYVGRVRLFTAPL